MRHHSPKTANVAIGHKGWRQASAAPAEKPPKATISQVGFFSDLPWNGLSWRPKDKAKRPLDENLNTRRMPEKPLRTGACAIGARLEHDCQITDLRHRQGHSVGQQIQRGA